MKMLKQVKGIAACLVILCIWYSSTKAVETLPAYNREMEAENCLLCGENEWALLSYYKGQKNIGIINLHTGDFSPVEINRYTDSGTLIRSASKSMTAATNSFEGGFVTSVTPNTDRGYANVSLSFQKQAMDKKIAEKNICADCLTGILEKSWGDAPYSIGVIDFATFEVRLLEKSVAAFLFGDYYISCDYRERQPDTEKVDADLLVFYCPERYQ